MARKGSQRKFTLWSRDLGLPWIWEGKGNAPGECRDVMRDRIGVYREVGRVPLSWLVLPPGETPYLQPEKGK